MATVCGLGLLCGMTACAAPPDDDTNVADVEAFVDDLQSGDAAQSDSDTAAPADTAPTDTAAPADAAPTDTAPTDTAAPADAAPVVAAAHLCETDQDCAFVVADPCLGTAICLKSKLPWRCGIAPGSLVVCDPGKDTACKRNRCNPANGECALVAQPSGVPCVDSDPCTVDSACHGGQCKSGTASWCQCKKTADCGVFGDGDLCTGTLYCDLGTFPFSCRLNKATVVNCPASKDTECTKSTCAPLTGKCSMKQLKDGADCEDGDKSTAGDKCKKGVCKSGTEIAPCNDNADCDDDGDKCNGVSYCHKASGKCLLNPATVITCPGVSNTACIQNKCVPQTGQCVPTAVKDGTTCTDGDSCTKSETCKSGKCVAGKNLCLCTKDTDCKDDGNKCNGLPYCNLTTKKCEPDPTKVVVCLSGADSTCQKNACNGATGACKMTPVEDVKAAHCPTVSGVTIPNCRYEVRTKSESKTVNLSCDDGNKCTSGEICKGGACGGGTVDCECTADSDCAKKDDGNKCNGVWYCDKSKAKATCVFNPASKVYCPAIFGAPCLVNTCDPIAGKCGAKKKGVGVGCDDGKLCLVAETCNKDAKCVGKVNSCDDGKACTVDKCIEGEGCVHTAKLCDDANSCTVDACVAGSGLCSFNSAPLAGKACNDGHGCTVNDLCKVGLCVAGPTVACINPTGACGQALCASILGGAGHQCVVVPKAKGAPCDDGDACSLNSFCDGSVCKPGKDEALFSKVAVTVGGADVALGAVVAMPDGTYAVGGSQRKTAGGKPSTGSWWLGRLSAAGAVTGSFTTANAGEQVASVGVRGGAALKKGGVVFTGTTVSVPKGGGAITDGRAVALASGGTVVLWDKNFGTALDDALGGARSYPSGGFVTAGWQVGAKTKKDGRLLRVSDAGAIAAQWVGGGGEDDVLNGVGVLAGGEMIGAGSTCSDTTGKCRGWLVATHPDGKLKTQTAYGDEKLQGFADAVGLSDGSVVAVGYVIKAGSHRSWLLRVNEDTETLWSKISTAKFDATAIVALAGDRLLVAGTTEPGSVNADAWLAGLDKFGNVTWDVTRDFGGRDAGMAVAATANGGAMMVGLVAAKSTNQERGIVVRTDPWGGASCKESGKCLGQHVKGCDDDTACTRDRCNPKTGKCDNVVVLAMECDAADGCSLTGVCKAGKCQAGARGKLYMRVHDDLKLLSVASVQPDGNGGLLTAGMTTTKKLGLIRTDRHGEVVSTEEILVSNMKFLGGVMPMSDGGIVFTYVEGDHAIVEHVTGKGASSWKVQVRGAVLPTLWDGIHDFQVPALWDPLSPPVSTVGLDAVSGTELLVSGLAERPTKAFNNHYFEKRCAWQVRLRLSDGKVLASGSRCGGAISLGYAASPLRSHSIPTSARVRSAVDGGSFAIGSGKLYAYIKFLPKLPVGSTPEHWYTTLHEPAYITRWSAAGDIKWSNNYGQDHRSTFTAMVETDQGALAVGYGESKAGSRRLYTAAVDSGGAVKWQRYEALSGAPAVDSISAINGGDVLLAGTVKSGATRRFWVRRATSFGVKVVDHYWALSGGVLSAENAVLHVTDDARIIAGGASAQGNVKLAIIRSDPWGHATCGDAGKCSGKKATACDDAKTCTFDYCVAGSGCAHKPVVCADNKPCTIDSCNEQSGCVHTANTCDDNDACTADNCNPLADPVVNANGCNHTQIPCSSDDNQCTADTCDKVKGCIYTTTNEGKSCFDAKCNTGDCKAGLCSVDKKTPLAGCKEEVPGTTCAAINKSRPDAKDGKYWLDWDGTFGNKPALYQCDMKGGGWTLFEANTFESGADSWTTGVAHQPIGHRAKCGKLTSFIHHDKAPFYKVFQGLPPHTQVRFVFDAVAYEYLSPIKASLYIDDSKTKAWSIEFKSKPSENHCNTNFIELNDGKVPGIVVKAPHTGSTVKPSFNKTGGDFHFGIDNFNLWVR